MKNLLIAILIFTSLSALGQTGKEIPLSVSYFGHVAYQPGIKIGTELPFMSQPSDSLKKWIISPQFGVFTNPGDDRHTLLNLEVGIKKPISGKNAYRIFSAGLGWLRQSKVNSFAVNLGSGNTSDTQRIGDNFIMPTLNYEYGWATHRKLSWYTKIGLGRRLFGRQEATMMLFGEFGVKFKLKVTKQ